MQDSIVLQLHVVTQKAHRQTEGSNIKAIYYNTTSTVFGLLELYSTKIHKTITVELKFKSVKGAAPHFLVNVNLLSQLLFM
jgi:hypothetical protein